MPNGNQIPACLSWPRHLSTQGKVWKSQRNNHPPKPYEPPSLNFIDSPLTISISFNSLFKVLFNFRSRYLFTIGLSIIFSFRWNLPPFQAAVPNSPTLQPANINETLLRNHYEIITLLDTAFQRTCVSKSMPTRGEPQNYNSTTPIGIADLKFELYPVHSPLLRVSLLFSFPPLINMLKFGG